MDKNDFTKACLEGGQAVNRALRAMLADYGPALRRDAWSMLRDEDRARDLVQEVLLKAWHRCKTFKGQSEVFAWLKQILRRSGIDMLRREAPEVPLQDVHGQVLAEVETALRSLAAAPQNEPEDAALARQQAAVFERCATRFAAEQPQAAQVMRWIAEDDLAPAAIAELLQRSPGATREYLSQCRKKARVYFADWYALVADHPAGARHG